MKAVVCTEYGLPDKLSVEEVPDPQVGDDEVVIDVKAAGVNFPDTLIIQNKYQYPAAVPFTPGFEAAGVVSQVGRNVTHLTAGDRALLSLRHGGFAEKAAGAANKAYKIPDAVPFEQACGFLLTYGTSYHAFRDRADLKEGETLLVLGASGGTGLSAVDLGKVMGARVIAAASSEEKLDIARKYGADETILYPSGALSREQQKALSDQIKELTGGKGVDVVYDPVGGPLSEPSLRAMAWNGRFLVIGFASGEIPRIPLNLALLKSCQIVGVFWGRFAEEFPEKHRATIAELFGLIASKKLNPLISARYPLDQAPQALIDLMDRKVKGKVVIVP